STSSRRPGRPGRLGPSRTVAVRMSAWACLNLLSLPRLGRFGWVRSDADALDAGSKGLTPELWTLNYVWSAPHRSSAGGAPRSDPAHTPGRRHRKRRWSRSHYRGWNGTSRGKAPVSTLPLLADDDIVINAGKGENPP